MSRCLFCAIVEREEVAVRVLEEEHCVAFLDTRPLFPGHVLLVPRAHHVTLADLPKELVAPLFITAQRLCRAVQEAEAAPGSFVAMNNVVSQSVPHLHVHIVPRRPKDGLRGFFWPRTTYHGEEAREQTAAGIRAALLP